nr:hypothetical protein CFP56_68279 [Quercus suber]
MSIDIEKDFSKLKDKQIDEALSKVEKVGLEAVVKFKALDEYLNKLCDYYVEGFDLFRKYLVKHHPKLDFSKLDMKAVKNEVLADRQSTKVVGEGGEAATIDEAVDVDLSSFVLP